MCRFISGLRFCSVGFFLYMDIFQMVLIIVFYRVSWNLILQFLQLLIFKQGLLDPK